MINSEGVLKEEQCFYVPFVDSSYWVDTGINPSQKSLIFWWSSSCILKQLPFQSAVFSPTFARMTVIAARKTDDAIVFAADSMISDGYVRSIDADIVHSKLFQQNGMVIGCTGLCYESTMMELFSRNHKPVDSSRLSVIDFLVEFREWVRQKESGYKPSNLFLISFDKKLFCVCGGIEVYEVKQFESIGAGKDFAKAALYLGHTPREAVEVACKLSLHCSEPIIEFVVDL